MHRILLILLLLPQVVIASDYNAMPHVSKKARDSFQFDYTYATNHKAFAIAPGGAWSWVAGKASLDEAKQQALAACGNYTQQKCVVYAANENVLYDREKWIALWGPYQNAGQAKKARVGIKVGQKFPDVVFTDPSGNTRSISDLEGKVLFVHFWGSWCPSCRYEFASLIDMYRILNDTMGDNIKFVILQVRESAATASDWAKQNNYSALQLSDSGVKSAKQHELTLQGGKKIADRKLASAFPASYVVDKHGLVVFSHMGSITDWSEYVPFFMDVAAKSGK